MSILGVTGFRPISPRNFLIHEGAVFRNINASHLRNSGGFVQTDWAAAVNAANTWTSANDELVAPALWGATRGGGASNFNAPIEQIPDVDGVRGPVMGLDIRNSADCRLTFTVLELRDKDTMKIAMGAADLDEHGSYWEVTPRMNVELGDYIPNVALAVTVNDNGILQPMVCILENAIVVNQFQMQTQRGNAAGVAIELRGSAPLDDPLSLPIHMFVPKRSGSGS